MATQLPARPLTVLGLSREEEAMTVEEYFDRFAWEVRSMDAEAMTAEEFLDAL